MSRRHNRNKRSALKRKRMHRKKRNGLKTQYIQEESTNVSDATFDNALEAIVNETQHIENGRSISDLSEIESICSENRDLSKSTNSSIQDFLCLPECQYGGLKGDASMLRCSMCMRLVHVVCCGDPPSHIRYDGSYNCSHCRTLFERVTNIEKQLECMHQLNTELLKLLQIKTEETMNLQNLLLEMNNKTSNGDTTKDSITIKSNCKGLSPVTVSNNLVLADNTTPSGITKRKRKQKPKLTEAQTSNNSLKRTLTMETSNVETRWTASPSVTRHEPFDRTIIDVSTPDQRNLSPNSQGLVGTSSDQPEPIPELPVSERMKGENTSVDPLTNEAKPKMVLFGDSMVRNMSYQMSTVNNLQACVYSTSGLRLDAAAAQVQKVVEGFTSKDTIVLHVGTVDVEYRDHLEMIQRYGQMIDNVRKSSSDCNIMVSALSYRTHEGNGKYNQKIDKFNGALRLLCPSYKNCTFHDFNPVAVKSNFKEDGLHFNRNGSVTFAKQLANIMKNFYMVLNQTIT